ncbi:putative uncharacterized protein [Burkholderiales bacterium GJ-E10]|nr:putative uncharacterized protein [Burkholderiales bacterium GJ-E10]
MPDRAGRDDRLPRGPEPEEVRAARRAAGLTQAQAGALVHTTQRVWGGYEADEGKVGHRRMHPAMWELFLLKTKAKGEWK